jgi:hypothetical protein
VIVADEGWPEGYTVIEPDDVVHVFCARCNQDIAIFGPLVPSRWYVLDEIRKHMEAYHPRDLPLLAERGYFLPRHANPSDI